jgi:selenide, water dikinase
MNTPIPRLTSLSHGGGCGCKIAPGVLADLLTKSTPVGAYSQLLVGTETSDDAAVYRLNDEQAIIATTDFFMPIVDDPFDFGRIAATNALSDVYAMGGTPLFALAILAMPIKVLPPEVIREILRGGESVCADANIPIAGGHSIDSVEPIYGLAALGVVHPDHLKRNSTSRAGDDLVLGKPLGIGIFSAALKKGQLSDADYRTMVESTTLLNRPGSDLAQMPGVHSITDVTGFGLLGHLLEMCRGSNLAARVSMKSMPVFDRVLDFANAGVVTGASDRNWAAYGDYVRLAPELGKGEKALLSDPQTSGGLLVSCAPETTPDVLRIFRSLGFARAARIGSFAAGPVGIQVDG